MLKVRPEFTVKEVFPKIFHLRYTTMGAMTRSMIRFQEFYEHPAYKGKVFTVKHLKDHTEALKEKFVYFTDTYGFNFPSSTLEPFIKGKFDPLSKREKDVLAALKDKKGSFYVIATYKTGDKGDIAHELGHALYWTRPKYRKKVKEILADQAKVGGMPDWTRAMKKAGYHDAVIPDETHAYLMESDTYLTKRFGKEIPRLERFKQARKRLWDNFNLEVGS